MGDDYAKQIVDHWINGAGEKLTIKDNENWDHYMTSNNNTHAKICDAAYSAFLQGEASFGEECSWVALSANGKGGYTTGYDLINGSNTHKGGFSYHGEIIKDGNDNYTITELMTLMIELMRKKNT